MTVHELHPRAPFDPRETLAVWAQEGDDADDAVPVDTGRVLIVDPCHLPDSLVRSLTTPLEHDTPAPAVLVPTPFGDGWYPIGRTDTGELVIDVNPHRDETDDDTPQQIAGAAVRMLTRHAGALDAESLRTLARHLEAVAAGEKVE
jgi:hypothetical protein